jgi:hypothetical protein
MGARPVGRSAAGVVWAATSPTTAPVGASTATPSPSPGAVSAFNVVDLRGQLPPSAYTPAISRVAMPTALAGPPHLGVIRAGG